MDAAPAGPGTPKKGADADIDGRLTFTDVGGQLRTVIVSVKSGGVNRSMVGDLAGVVQGEGAAMGLLITLEEPTKPMLLEAAKAGEFESELSKRSYSKIQISTIRELLDGRKPEIPLLVLPAYEQAEKVEKESPGRVEMFGWTRRRPRASSTGVPSYGAGGDGLGGPAQYSRTAGPQIRMLWSTMSVLVLHSSW